MERVLDVYRRPYDPERPVVCTDELPEQLTAEARPPLPTRPGSAEKMGHEYVRHGVCCVWMFDEPPSGRREVRATAAKTAVDRAHGVWALVDHPRCAEAERIKPVCDRLNTHTTASFDKAFPPEEAHRAAGRVELVHTPKHGSWLNTAECELSVLVRQCLGRRIAEFKTVAAEATAWAAERNRTQVGVDWRAFRSLRSLRLGG